MMPTSDLIDSLVESAQPVRRLRPPLVRAACWLLFAALMLGLVAIGHGVRPDLVTKLGQPAFVLGIAGALATGVLATAAAFVASVPGRSRRWLLLPAPAILVWVSTIGYGCLTDWVSIGPDGINLGETARCFATMAVVSIPLSLVMLIMLRYVARLAAAPIAMMASLAVAAMTAAALSLFHPLDATLMVLISNFGVAALFLLGSGMGRCRLFGWVASA
ncbi:NrsF family protein [Cupriavidus sp. D39]|uniref:NrsF family protein n=1 Tax=Cupriavidus sp. D39 TaxID=2997877 RepID=UPI00226D40E1|nr:NrsF family protein [Cupriavidus sp. D39]MCY0856398.1 NrsF family protein [Cupriavidus sp. D39]